MTGPDPRDRIQTIEWARGLLAKHDRWLIIDTETTGIAPTDEVIQIGVLAADGATVFDSLVRPYRATVHPDAQRVHRVTPESLSNAPTYADISPRLDAITRGKQLIAYNVEFDRRMLAQSARAAAAPRLSCSWDCAMLAYSRFVGEWDFRKNDYKWHKLPSAAHDAIGDCRATLELIQHIAAASA